MCSAYSTLELRSIRSRTYHSLLSRLWDSRRTVLPSVCLVVGTVEQLGNTETQHNKVNF